MRKLQYLIVLLVTLLTPWVYGSTETDLYRATVSVSDYSDGERLRAIRDGLAQVLVKITGSSKVIVEPEVRQFLLDSPGILLDFSYAKTTSLEQADAPELALALNYSATSINEFIRSQQLPIWPVNREPVLVWVVFQDSEGSYTFASQDTRSDIYQPLAAVAHRRGLPFSFPLLDLEDQLALKPDSAWLLDEAAIASASNRYSVHQWLVVRLYQTSGGNWRGAALLGAEQNSQLLNAQGDQLEGVINSLIDQATDRIASQANYVPQHQSSLLTLTVSGVGTMEDYRGIMDTLKNLSMVRETQVLRVMDDSLTLTVALEGESAQLAEQLRRFPNLDSGPPHLNTDGHLLLQWHPSQP